MKLLRSFTIIATFILAALAFAPQASAAGNVHGFAWSDSAGWISMNCDNSNIIPANYSVPSSCGTVDYGVNLDLTTGVMSGYGWSTNLGWVRFDQVTTTPTYPQNRAGGARVTGIGSGGVRQVTGWLRYCSDFTQTVMPDNCGSTDVTTITNGGWNGWVSMFGDGSDGGTRYGVTYDTSSQQFDGLAWGGTTQPAGSGSEVVGWILFKGVYVDKNPTTYIPVVKLSSTPVIPGGDTTITYTWVNADSDPAHQLVACQAFSAPANMTNWTTGTFTSQNLPILTARQIQNVFVVAPSTTYYLDCKNASGMRAADPSAPTVQCVPGSPAATCPRTTANVITPTGNLVMAIKADASAIGLGAGPVDVNAGETVSLSWKSTQPISGCTGYSDQGVFNWQTQGAGGTAKASVSGTVESGVAVAAPSTNYFMSCVIGGVLTWSNVVTANVKNTGNDTLTLLGRPNGTNNPYLNSFAINQGLTVQLQWTSNTDMTGCKAIALTSPEPTNWFTGQSKLGTSGPAFTQNETDIFAPTNPTRYQLQCSSPRGTVTSNVVTVNVDTPTQSEINLEISTDGVNYSTGVVVPSGTFVSLRWTATGALSPNTCQATSSPIGTYWSGNVANPTASVSGIDLDRTLGNVTTYTILCRRLDGSTTSSSVTATPLPPNTNTPTLAISGPTCVKNDTIAFDLAWSVTNANGGTVSIDNDGGQAWSGTYAVSGTNASDTYTNLHVTNPSVTVFRLKYLDMDGNSYGPIIHNVTIDPNCTQAPHKNWFFRFFEK